MTYKEQAERLVAEIKAGAISLPHTITTQASYLSYKVYLKGTGIVPRENLDKSITLYEQKKAPTKRKIFTKTPVPTGEFCATQSCGFHKVISLDDGWKRQDHCKRYAVDLRERFNERGVPVPLRCDECIKEFGR